MIKLCFTVFCILFIFPVKYFNDCLFDIGEISSNDVYVCKKSLNQRLEEFFVFKRESRCVHVSQSFHDNTEFIPFTIITLKLSCHD